MSVRVRPPAPRKNLNLMTSISDNLVDIRKRIANSALRTGRDPEDIKLIAVTKTVSIENIREAIAAGLRVFGENRVQEAKDKILNLKSQASDLNIEWHLIGHLQRNKARIAVQLFHLIHSLDSVDLAEELNKHAEKISKVQDVLVEVKLSHEDTKHGVLKEELTESLKAVAKMENLNLRGLMTIPPFFDNPEHARPYFRELIKLRDRAEVMGFNLPELSMGMSSDFETAIEEGATMVRIGTAIFGER